MRPHLDRRQRDMHAKAEEISHSQTVQHTALSSACIEANACYQKAHAAINPGLKTLVAELKVW